MTLTIELTPEEEARLRQEAAACGLETQEYAHRKLVRIAANGAPRRLSGFGMFADVPVSSEDFAARKQEEKEKEDRLRRGAA